MGKSNPNPILESRLYKLEFIDRNKKTLYENVIAENILSQVDYKGRKQRIIDEIVDHRCDQTKSITK